MKSQLAIGLAAATLLSACANGLPGLRPLTYQEPAETRLLVSPDNCPSTTGPQFAPVVAAIVTAAASKLLEGFGTALAKGAEGGKLPASVAALNIELGEKPPRCIFVIRGRFTPDDDHAKEIKLPTPNSGIKNPPKVYVLQHYLELQMLFSKNSTAMTFAPVMSRIERSMDGSESGSRELSVALKFDKPGSDKSIGGAVLLSDRRVGKTQTYGPLSETGRFPYEAPWFGVLKGVENAPPPPEAPASGAAGTAGPQPGAVPGAPIGSPPRTAAVANSPYPVTVTVTVVESRPTNDFLAFAASVFGAVTPTLENQLKGAIDPATIKANESASLDAEGTYASALGTAYSSIAVYCAIGTGADKLADRFAKSGDARKAQLAANKAAIAIDLKAPFTTLIEISGSDPKVANPTLCTP